MNSKATVEHREDGLYIEKAEAVYIEASAHVTVARCSDVIVQKSDEVAMVECKGTVAYSLLLRYGPGNHALELLRGCSFPRYRMVPVEEDDPENKALALAHEHLLGYMEAGGPSRKGFREALDIYLKERQVEP